MVSQLQLFQGYPPTGQTEPAVIPGKSSVVLYCRGLFQTFLSLPSLDDALLPYLISISNYSSPFHVVLKVSSQVCLVKEILMVVIVWI